MPDTISAAIVGGTAGAAVAAFIAFVNNLLQRRHDRAMRVLDHCAQLGLENWRLDTESARRRVEAGHGPQEVLPLDMYVIQAYGLANVLSGRQVDLQPLYDDWRNSTKSTRQAAAQAREDYRARAAKEVAERGDASPPRG